MALFIPGILMQGIYTGIIGTISSVTMSTCSLAKTLYTHQNPNVNKIIRSLDIERKLKIITAVIKKIDRDVKTEISDLEKTQVSSLVQTTDFLNSSIAIDPIELCLKYLHETIREIRKDLIAINKLTIEHNAKWFASWRTLDIDSYVKNLKINSKILDSRFDDLTKISLFLHQRNKH